MRNLLLRIVLQVRLFLVHVLWRIMQLFPINPKKILFESEGDFCDNSWALYMYMRRHYPKFKYVWFVRNPEKFKKLNNTVFISRMGLGLHLRALYHYSTALFSFHTHGTMHPYIPRSGQNVVTLWHGAPIKGCDKINNDYYDYSVVIGKAAIPLNIKFMGKGTEENTLPLGYPRNDILVANIAPGNENPFVENGRYEKVLLWMPTFRASKNATISEMACDNETGLPLFSTKSKLFEFDEFLGSINSAVVLKIHHLQVDKPVFSEKFSNIVIVTDNDLQKHNIQLYEMVGKTDALITDYSSIGYDYLLVDKPQAYILDDIEEYALGRGFIVKGIDEVKKLMPGRHVYDINSLEIFIRDIVAGKDECKNIRQRMRKEFHAAPYGDACKKICNWFGIGSC